MWLVAYPPGTPRWKRWWYRIRPPEPGPPPAHTFEPPGFLTPPDDEIGVPVHMRKVIASNSAVVVAITHCVAYSTGFQLGIGIRRRDEPARPEFRIRGMPPPRPTTPPEMSLELGIRFADGRRSDHSGHGPPEEFMSYYRDLQEGRKPELPPGPVIAGWGGGGGGKRWDMEYWVWPLPPDGPMTVTCEWPLGDLPASSQELDGGAIRRAGESNEKLWDADHL